APRDRDRVELNRAELVEDREHAVCAPQRPRGREKVAGDKEAPCVLGGDLHRADASWILVSVPTRSRPGDSRMRARSAARQDDRAATRERIDSMLSDAVRRPALARDAAGTLIGQTFGLVAVTAGLFSLGAYL